MGSCVTQRDNGVAAGAAHAGIGRGGRLAKQELTVTDLGFNTLKIRLYSGQMPLDRHAQTYPVQHCQDGFAQCDL